MGDSRGLVLSAGAHGGALWEVGMIIGLRRAGVDLGAADLIVGTSQAAFMATLTALTDTADELEHAVRTIGERRQQTYVPEVEADQFMHTLYTASDTSPSARERRQRLGALACESDTERAAPRLDIAIAGLPSDRWPDDRDLVLPTVETESGERAVWRRADGVPLPTALRAACTIPTVFRPVEIAGRHHMDGMAYSLANADLAAGHDRVLVLLPLRPLLPDAVVRRELAALDPGRTTVIGPDAESVEAFKTSLFDPRIWVTFLEFGQRQAAARAAEIAAAWTG
ncbi:patatin-like phospholipase family protein [Actinomadura rayongensis]|uniref:Patatin-like phospholipase family protein n=1 Tax=Actinomadura rayongensis TaxID=1429076 RepID=A0A6I4WCE8_9ACTN|nr:patatin-like phospholipase family protein [Actinomadura rayongensis]